MWWHTRRNQISSFGETDASPFKSAGASVQSTTGSRGVRTRGSNAGYTMFRGSVKCTGYPLHSPVSPSLPLTCVNVCHHISTGLYTTTLSKSVSTRHWCSEAHKNAVVLGEQPDSLLRILSRRAWDRTWVPAVSGQRLTDPWHTPCSM